jgi:hypothetical protein
LIERELNYYLKGEYKESSFLLKQWLFLRQDKTNFIGQKFNKIGFFWKKYIKTTVMSIDLVNQVDNSFPNETINHQLDAPIQAKLKLFKIFIYKLNLYI